MASLPLPLLLLISPFVLAAAVLAWTYLYTNLRYRLSLRHYTSAFASTKPQPPPHIPYTVPFLGSALQFLTRRPGEYWPHLFKTHPRSTGACTILLGGQTTHLLFSPSAILALFKARGPTRDGFNQDILEKCMGIKRREALRYYALKEGADDTGLTPLQQQERINDQYLLKTSAVDEMTSKFTEVLRAELETELTGGDDEIKEVGLYAWLQEHMFKASTTAFMGSRILEIYPELREEFFDFDRVMLSLLMGIPKFIIPDAHEVRTKVLDGMERFHLKIDEERKGKVVDPDGDINWEPTFGSRANRARQVYYERRGLETRTRAGLDLGMLFGLSSNAIPASGWMLMHILDPNGDKTLLGRVMDELVTARSQDGSVDIATLCALPLLHSIFHETLRLYVDVFVTRQLKDDIVVPLDDGKRRLLLKKSGVVIAPSWLGSRDETRWLDPPPDVFYAERFMRVDQDTGRQAFTTSGTAGKFFPFGGGKTICPGRVFAKQEVLGSVAMVLLSFDFEFVEFLNEQGKSTERFPGLREGYSGSGVIAMDGDMSVRMRRRKR
ncbi:cytochrome P450 [Lepidopterella palustris CBS 459.81]|uniref:Cytochrome P450 n=1 Tax=Lepidopterella palustris CBS 459.81 TaxID=1314670 RepID=A0A8E2EJU4_9PEZI|nr:cytochrome P450 [Lepidopterella palustris CBS 459.81]